MHRFQAFLFHLPDQVSGRSSTCDHGRHLLRQRSSLRIIDDTNLDRSRSDDDKVAEASEIICGAHRKKKHAHLDRRSTAIVSNPRIEKVIPNVSVIDSPLGDLYIYRSAMGRVTAMSSHLCRKTKYEGPGVSPTRSVEHWKDPKYDIKSFHPHQLRSEEDMP